MGVNPNHLPPTVAALMGLAATKPRAKRFEGPVAAKKEKSRLHTHFELAYRGPELAAEVRFHPTRKWRMDLAHVETKVAVEFHGAIWAKGRHTRGKGFAEDRDKMASAQELGWIVFEICDVRSVVDWARRVEQAIEQRQHADQQPQER
jgi:hypothetical protein